METESPDKVRKPTEKENKEFDKVNNKLDSIAKESHSNVLLRKKIFMKISDVDTEDAAWFKGFCDKHTMGKQFLGIKVIRGIVSTVEPLADLFKNYIQGLENRIDSLEIAVAGPMPEEEDNKIIIPKTQGKKVVK